MIIHEGYENLHLKNPVVTLGTFDGVHRGHRALLRSMVKTARRSKGESVAVTFDPHPRLVLSGKTDGLFFLTTLDEKKKLLKATGIDHLVIIEFNDYIRNMEACEFIRIILAGKIGIKHLIVGYDHHFGKGRAGDFVTIRECAEKYGFTVEKVKEVSAEKGPISSTSIREAILAGRLEEANDCLGYSYTLSGTVIEGRRLGRAIGFPTANIKPIDKYKLIPANGVYAVEVEFDGSSYPGMLSIGNNPTVNTDPAFRSIEVNIFGFDGILYGHEIRVVFKYRLREEIKFDTISQLTKQMEIDKERSLRLLGEQ